MPRHWKLEFWAFATVLVINTSMSYASYVDGAWRLYLSHSEFLTSVICLGFAMSGIALALRLILRGRAWWRVPSMFVLSFLAYFLMGGLLDRGKGVPDATSTIQLMVDLLFWQYNFIRFMPVMAMAIMLNTIWAALPRLVRTTPEEVARRPQESPANPHSPPGAA